MATLGLWQRIGMAVVAGWCLPLAGQSMRILAEGREWIVWEDAVYGRSLQGDRFEPIGGGPMLPPGVIARQTEKAFDGGLLYLFEYAGSKALRLRSAEPMNTPNGKQWFWHAPVLVKKPLNPLAAHRGRVVASLRGDKDEKGESVYLIDAIELPSGNTQRLLTLPDPHHTVQAVATVREGEVFLFVNTGDVYLQRYGASAMEKVDAGLFEKASEKFISFVIGPKGERIPQAPMLLAPPLFSCPGEILLPVQIREKNRWTESASQRFFNDLPEEEKTRLIADGRWPPKSWDYEGSDFVFAMIHYDLETKRVSLAPLEGLESLFSVDPYTGQKRLTGLGVPALTQSKAGRFLTIREAIAPPKPVPSADSGTKKPAVKESAGKASGRLARG